MSHDSFFKQKPEVENFKPVSILVFKNGDEYDPGTKVMVTRHRFPHWLHLLDYLTTRLQPNEGPVHHLYDLYQNELLHFKELENDGVYVAANKKFKHVVYNSKRHFGASKKPFDTTGSLPSLNEPIKFLNSKESNEIYLKNRNFRPNTLRDMWDDSVGKRTKTVSVGEEFVKYDKEQQTNVVNGQMKRKFPYHLYESKTPRNNTVTNGMVNNEVQTTRNPFQRSFSEPKMKVANVGAIPKQQANKYSYVSQPKVLYNANQIVQQHTKEVNMQTDSFTTNQVRNGQNYFGQSKSTSGIPVRRMVRNNTVHSSFSDSKLKNDLQSFADFEVNGYVKPYLEIYKYYKPTQPVGNEKSTHVVLQHPEAVLEREVATQTLGTERATNTTASYLKQRTRNKTATITTGTAQGTSPPRTLGGSAPYWAKELQQTVSELSYKVQQINM